MDRLAVTKEMIAFAIAMSKFQGEITGALKDSENPFYSSNYADLASCWDAIREPLVKNGLSIMQLPSNTDTSVVLETIVIHEAGYSVSSTMTVKPVKNDPQGIGACLTYMRRYALSAVTGLAQVDDDGNEASGIKEGDTKKSTNKSNGPSQKQLEYINSLIKKNWNWADFSAKWGITKLSELDGASASDAIEELLVMVKPQGAPAPDPKPKGKGGPAAEGPPDQGVSKTKPDDHIDGPAFDNDTADSQASTDGASQ